MSKFNDVSEFRARRLKCAAAAGIHPFLAADVMGILREDTCGYKFGKLTDDEFVVIAKAYRESLLKGDPSTSVRQCLQILRCKEQIHPGLVRG